MYEEDKKDASGPILEIKECYVCVVEGYFFRVDEAAAGSLELCRRHITADGCTNCPPWLKFKFTDLKWLKMHSNYPP